MSINNDTMYKVKNRSGGKVAYTVQYGGNKIHQVFNPGEVKVVPYAELRQLSYQHGGPELIYNYLQVNSVKVLNSLNLNPEPEYYMNEAQVKDLLINGSLDAFLDCLDFAPTGVIDLIKKYAVELPLNDYEKRQAILKQLNFNVDKAIENDRASKENETPKEAPTRRVTEKKEETSNNVPQRRTASKYIVPNEQ